MARALEFRVTVPQYLLTRTSSTFSSTAPAGWTGGLRSVEQSPLALPGPDWVMLEPIASGICGTDLAALSFTGPTALEPFCSFPAIMGHEILARVVKLGAGVQHLEVGDRVVVDPLITCQTRGVRPDDWCHSCKNALPGACHRAGEAGPLEVDGRPLARGNYVGFHTQLPGGWSRQMMAPAHQLFTVPSALADESAVLTEPLAVAVHSVVGLFDQLKDNALVIGSGPIALAAVWALRALGYEGKLYAQMKRERERQLAEKLGADVVVRPGDSMRKAVVALGAKPYKPLIGSEVYMGGFHTIFDCVGKSQSLHQAVRLAAAGGTIAMLGCCTQVNNVDLTFLWARELSVRGFLAYGPELWQGRRLHTFALTLELLERAPLPVTEMITHQFSLQDYKKAFSALYRRSVSGALKVILKP